jgi:glycolate oxidase iron-sulfur subunit
MLLDLASSTEIIDDCIQCGLCLDSCPTYLLWGRETDSPRGRIVQIGEAISVGGDIPPATVGHIDSCVGCMACVTACPSGVAYDRLLVDTRGAIEHQHARKPADQALRLLALETLPYPSRLTKLLPVMSATKRFGTRRRAPGPLASLSRLLPDLPSCDEPREPLASHTPAVGPARGRVGLLLGCVQRVFAADVHRATVAVLTREGFDVLAPGLPDCCGALELGAGEREHASARAEATIAAFAELGDLDAIIVNAGGCGATMKDYGALLDTEAAWAFAGRVRDVSEFLAEVEPRAPRGPLALKVAYHDACQLSHGQGVRDAPRALLASIPELELLEVAAERDICCGAPGLYSLLQPEPSAALGERRAAALIATGAQVVAAASPSCLMQIGRHAQRLGSDLEIRHPVELLWRSLDAAPR